MPHDKSQLVSMKKTAEEKKAEGKEDSVLGSSDDYPWGLRLNLDKESLDKLDVDLKVGQEVYVSGLAKVVRVSESADENVERHSVELQITDIGITNASDSGKSDSDVIYNKTK